MKIGLKNLFILTKKFFVQHYNIAFICYIGQGYTVQINK